MTADPAGTWTDHCARAAEDERRDEQIARLAPAPPMPAVAPQEPRTTPQAASEQQALLVLSYVSDIKDHLDSIVTLLGACRADACSVERGWGFENAADQFRLAFGRASLAAYENQRDVQVTG